MSFGDGNLHVENERLKGRATELETLVRQLAEVLSLYTEVPDWIAERMEALGIEAIA